VESIIVPGASIDESGSVSLDPEVKPQIFILEKRHILNFSPVVATASICSRRHQSFGC